MGSAVLAYLAGLIGSAIGRSRYGPAALPPDVSAPWRHSACWSLVIAFGFSIGLNEQVVRTAALLLTAAGLFLLIPRAQTAFATATGSLVNGGNRMLGRISGDGLGGQFVIGTLLGLVWAPYVGPTLGVAHGYPAVIGAPYLRPGSPRTSLARGRCAAREKITARCNSRGLRVTDLLDR